MKNLITTIAIGFTMLSAKANYGSALNLKMFENGRFTVILDDHASYSRSNIFHVTDIQPGYHKIKVVRSVISPYAAYPVSQLVYRGWISVPARSTVFAQINCRRELDVVKVEPNFCGPEEGECSGSEWENEGGYDLQHGNHGNYGNHQEQHGNGWGTVIPPAPPEYGCMSYENFMQLKNSMANKSFEDSRMEIAKQALAYNYFTASQVLALAHLFTFESNKLEFAETAYVKTIDKQNYFLVNDAFTFENSISALDEFIATRN
jgi:hypothetical protein